MAFRDEGRDNGEWPVEYNPGCLVPIEVLMDCFIAFHDHRILPHAGGWLDQDYHLTEALLDLEYRVAWHKRNNKRTDFNQLPKFEEQAAAVRKAYMRDNGSNDTG
ncbi:MAG: hypothetical protein GTO60_16695 [Gammaproteobacteria bacterium]|nr:hypothetical protein [Gammaproteobacteria bacterium]